MKLNSASEKVLITAINSFTGRYLKKELIKHNYAVLGTVSHHDDEEKNLFCDITDRENINEIIKSIRPDYIIHLAGITFVPHSDIREIYNVNLFGTLNLLDACLYNNIIPKKIIIPSSANVYGNPANVSTIDENYCPLPVNHYANSKLAMENIVRTYFEKLPIIISRPFNYTGVGQSNNFIIPKIVHHFKENKNEIELGNTDVVRDFSDVRFVVDVYRQLLELPVHSEIFNVCSGNGVSIEKIVKLCTDITGLKMTVKVNPMFVRKNEIKMLLGDNSKLKNYLYNLCPVNIEDTLRWMLT